MLNFSVGRLIVVTLWAPDIPEILYFYSDILGLQLLPHHEKQPAFDVGDGVHLMIRRGTPIPAEDADPFPVIAFQVNDLNQTIQHLNDHGVEITTEIITNPSARYIMFRDPAGNLLEVAELSAGAHE